MLKYNHQSVKEGFLLDAQTCLSILRDVYKDNQFISYCGITIDAVKCGEATLSLVVDNTKHTNQYGFTHGGALEALADIALGVACETVGKRVMTLSFNMNFLFRIMYKYGFGIFQNFEKAHFFQSLLNEQSS